MCLGLGRNPKLSNSQIRSRKTLKDIFFHIIMSLQLGWLPLTFCVLLVDMLIAASLLLRKPQKAWLSGFRLWPSCELCLCQVMFTFYKYFFQALYVYIHYYPTVPRICI